MREAISRYVPLILLVLAYTTAAVLFVLSSELFRTWFRRRDLKTILGCSALAGFAGILSLALPFRYNSGWLIVLLFLLISGYGLHRFASTHAKALRIRMTLFAAIGIAISISSSLGIFSEPRSAAALNRTLDTTVQTLSSQKGDLVKELEWLAQDDRVKGVISASDKASMSSVLQQLMVQRELSSLTITDTTSQVLARGQSGIRNDFLVQTEPWTINSSNGDTVAGIARTLDGKVSLVASTGIVSNGKLAGMVSSSREINSTALQKLRKNGQSLAIFSSSGLVSEGGATQRESLLLSSRALENELQSYLSTHPKSGELTERYLREQTGEQYRLIVRTLDTFTTETVALVILQPITSPTISPTASVIYSVLFWSLLSVLIWLFIVYRENDKKGGRHV